MTDTSPPSSEPGSPEVITAPHATTPHHDTLTRLEQALAAGHFAAARRDLQTLPSDLGAEEAARRNKALWRLSPDRAMPLLLVACLALFVALALWAR